ncbi:SdrD B-like domain-containing protein [Treponema sp.]|uniref:SdrD B-like domain-containing protein n=1 Tax=Treponema sp. TaxID=166 RepID=UPI003890FAB7
MKDKIHWTWKRIAGVIFGILGIGTLTSCYGVIEDEFEYDIYGNVKGNVNGTEQAIKDIVVQLSVKQSETFKTVTTDSDGWYEFRGLTAGDYTLKFTDTDGDANGGSFAQKEHSVTLKDDFQYSPVLNNAE